MHSSLPRLFANIHLIYLYYICMYAYLIICKIKLCRSFLSSPIHLHTDPQLLIYIRRLLPAKRKDDTKSVEKSLVPLIHIHFHACALFPPLLWWLEEYSSKNQLVECVKGWAPPPSQSHTSHSFFCFQPLQNNFPRRSERFRGDIWSNINRRPLSGSSSFKGPTPFYAFTTP